MDTRHNTKRLLIQSRKVGNWSETKSVVTVGQVVIHEALMLLQDNSAAAPDSSGDTVRRFISATRNTESLAKPAYIVVSHDATIAI